ncbi:MAG: hypothetical protein VST72_03975 [Nitrospirota bacterium]|nr:hypothetical protein [Nitrospirota bacterium]
METAINDKRPVIMDAALPLAANMLKRAADPDHEIRKSSGGFVLLMNISIIYITYEDKAIVILSIKKLYTF